MSFRNRFGACLIVAVAFILSCAAANQPAFSRLQSMSEWVRLTKFNCLLRCHSFRAQYLEVIGWPKGKMPTPRRDLKQ